VRTFTTKQILEAADQEEGFCLSCGERQPFLEARLILGLCHFCDQQDVLDAEVLARALTLIEEEE
jgi:hypothetical protein